jgi:hypothetical protein
VLLFALETTATSTSTNTTTATSTAFSSAATTSSFAGATSVKEWRRAVLGAIKTLQENIISFLWHDMKFNIYKFLNSLTSAAGAAPAGPAAAAAARSAAWAARCCVVV